MPRVLEESSTAALMSASLLPLNPQLSGSSRLRTIVSNNERVNLLEIATLIAAGITAATATGLLEFGLRIPGHAILKCIFPMILGLAIVPRQGAGTAMAGSAFVTGFFLRVGGPMTGLSVGAMTSLIVAGPILDWSMTGAKSPRSIALRGAFAGLLTNLIALAVRGGAKLSGFESLGKASFASWFGKAALTYPICGLLAGLLSALVWFSLQNQSRQNG